MAFSECCQPIVEGAWARSPPELARARFTAMQLGNAQLLADTTHPESLKAIGTKQQLLRKWEAEMRMRGAHQPSMVDMAFAQDPQDEDCWYVMSALTYPEMVKKPAKDSSPMVYIVAETYVKEAGRWCFYEFPRSFPTLEPLMNFIDKYEGNDSVVQPWDGVYEYSWLAVPPAPLAAPASPAPHSNDYNHDEQQAQQQQQGRGQGHRGWLVDGWTEPAAPGGWVYLDNAVDPDTGLTPAETAQVMARVMRSTDLRDPDPDFDTWYFRHGRFMGL